MESLHATSPFPSSIRSFALVVGCAHCCKRPTPYCPTILSSLGFDKVSTLVLFRITLSNQVIEFPRALISLCICPERIHAQLQIDPSLCSLSGTLSPRVRVMIRSILVRVADFPARSLGDSLRRRKHRSAEREAADARRSDTEL